MLCVYCCIFMQKDMYVPAAEPILWNRPAWLVVYKGLLYCHTRPVHGAHVDDSLSAISFRFVARAFRQVF